MKDTNEFLEQQYEEQVNRIKNYIIKLNTWVEIAQIAEVFGVGKYQRLIEDMPNTTIAQIINRSLKGKGFQTCRIYYLNCSSIWVAPDNLQIDDIPETAKNNAIRFKFSKDITLVKRSKKNVNKSSSVLSKFDEVSLDRLKIAFKEYRQNKALELNLPVYCIFDNKSLDDILNNLPKTEEEMYNIIGFGRKRVEKYGNDIIEIVRKFIDEEKVQLKQKDEMFPFNNTIDVKVVLNCIQKYDGRFSYNGIVKILKGYFGFKFIPGMENSEYYGIYKQNSDSDIEKAIDYLIEKNIIINDNKLKIKHEDDDLQTDKVFHEKRLQEIFGHNSFKAWQWNIISNLINKKRILSIQKTGGGKSLCFQYTGDYLHAKGHGVTIVFSPLQALMREQVKYLKSKGINAECIITSNEKSNIQKKEHKEIYEKVLNDEVSILYIAPERLNNPMWLEYSSKFKIAMVVIDEAHCISTWGHDFRIDYRRIVNLINLLPPIITVLCLTATANDIVANDIQEQIGNNLQIIRGSLERKNLNLNVIKTNDLNEKYIYMKNFINSQNGHGIVYVGTRADTKIFSDWLNYIGIDSIHYHAGLSDEQRVEVENALKGDKYKVIVSTNALGMGMDKKDVRFVIHSQMPSSLIAYYQEIGRAGRDNLPSNILLLYNDDDEELQKYFIETSKPSKIQYINTLQSLKKEDLSFSNLIKLINVKKQTMTLILKDLENSSHIIKIDNSKYSFVKDLTDEELDLINQYKQVRYADLSKMLQYIFLDSCRTKFICNYLNDYSVEACNHCDNCNQTVLSGFDKADFELLKAFFDDYFLYEKTPNCTIISSGYYKIEEIGELIKNSKYRNKGYFHDILLNRVVRAYYRYCRNENFDYILFVPPTISGDLVENFAQRISQKINIPFSKDLMKIKETEIPLKEAQSKLQKKKLLKDIFSLKNTEKYARKNILLIDDIIDSGTTINEISKLLLKCGVNKVYALTIAKTNVGDE